MLRVLRGLLAATSALAVLLVGRRRRRRAGGDVAAAILEDELELLERRAELLRRELALLEGRQAESPREVRIWMDGAFDMMHYGHANAFRKGRSLGTHLIVGVNDDASITACKGPPLMNDEERLAMVQACKWVDEVVPNVPYIMSEEYLRWAIHEYRIDYVVHGDDPCIVDGRDVYESARALGKYRTIPRTEGVSTTEIVGRMLALSTEHRRSLDQSSPDRDSPAAVVAFTRESKFLTTTSTYRIFSQGCAAPPAGARVVYVDGCWDVFHAGHADFLHEAAALGDFLLVGVHSDALVHRQRGKSFPILNLQERVLSVLACRHTGDVVICPPRHLTREIIAALQISMVARGSTHGPSAGERDPSEDLSEVAKTRQQDKTRQDPHEDPYDVAKQMGIFVSLPKRRALNVDAIVSRIHASHERISIKLAKKVVSEQAYYRERYNLPA